jgi:hypothetical protein
MGILTYYLGIEVCQAAGARVITIGQATEATKLLERANMTPLTLSRQWHLLYYATKMSQVHVAVI